jgi:hypothetical protein
MMLTPLDRGTLPGRLARFAEGIAGKRDRALFKRLAASGDRRAQRARAAAHHRAATAVLARFGMRLVPGPPRAGVSWDGQAARSGTEAYVLLHELAHFQLAAPARRARVDFGLGPGPETGRRGRAERAASVQGLAREREEAAASLLGILWELALGQPALASFLDQNWLEGADPAGHFTAVLAALRRQGFVTADGRPTRRLRRTPDPAAAGQESALRGAAW